MKAHQFRTVHGILTGMIHLDFCTEIGVHFQLAVLINATF